MNHTKSHWTSLGLVACTILLGAGFNAQAASPKVTLIASDSSALAGTTEGAFTLIRDGETNDALSVSVAISGTASNGVDYAAISTTLVIPAGFLAVDVPVQPIVDTVNRGNKTVVLTVQSNADYVIRGNHKASVKIVDDVFDIPPPTVSITSPADGSVFTAPATITIQAGVSDPDLPVTSVSFYANDTFLGRVTNGDYSLVVPKLHAGTYSLFARAVDEFGKSSVSEAVDITVSEGPVVSLTAPNGTLAFLGDVVPLQANIADSNEKISSVNFFLGNKSIGTVTSAPFVLNWQTTSNGIFNFHAVATDKSSGKKGTSPTLQIQVVNGGGGI